jgi:Tol biopolymer transport system component
MKPLTRIIGVGVASAIALLVAAPAQATFPAQNGRIAFYANRGENPTAQIYSIHRQGSGLRRLTDVAGDTTALHEDWSPFGRRIVFELDPGPTGGNIIEIMNDDGSGVTDLTGDRHDCEFEPSFTPNGQRIVFVRGVCGRGRHDEIWSMNLQGADRRKISDTPGVGALDPNVSPDGSRISFTVKRDPDLLGGALYTVRRDGTHLTKVVPFTFDVGIKSDWAPGGNHIVFTEYLDLLDGHTPNVATVRPNGSHLVQLTHQDGVNYAAVAGSYSPDGRWILFRFDNYKKGEYRLTKMRPDGSDKTPIARLGLKERGMDWAGSSD